MKANILLFLFVLTTSIMYAQLKVDTAGNIGIGTNPSASIKLSVAGKSYLNGYVGIGTTPSSTYKLNVSGKSFLGGDCYLNGNVGIGTEPEVNVKLNVAGNSQFVGTCDFNGMANFFSNVSILGPGPSEYGPSLNVVASTYYPGMTISAYPTYNAPFILTVDGDAYTTGEWVGSDLLLKNNVSNLDGKLILSKITNLSGKKYEFKSNEELERIYQGIASKENEYCHKPLNLPKGERYGFIAQEIEKEFPELVKTDPKTNLKAVNYEGMIPILLESIKEQQKMITQLQDQLSVIGSAPKLEAMSPSSKGLITRLDNAEITENTLYQNAPNPFTQSTTIAYYLKANTQNAKVGLYDMNGTQLRSISINSFGKGSVVIDAKQLKAGIYMYTLIVDGSLVDTKRMVLTD